MKNDISKSQDCFIKIGSILDSLDAQVNNLCPVTEDSAILQLEKEALSEIQREVNQFAMPNFFEQEEPK